MKIQHLFGFALLGAVALNASPSHATSCSRVASSAQFDSFYGALWGCQQTRINDMWSRFSFDRGDWDEGFGYEDVCNDSLPLKRTLGILCARRFAYLGRRM